MTTPRFAEIHSACHARRGEESEAATRGEVLGRTPGREALRRTRR
jgi:hypothetical protein